MTKQEQLIADITASVVKSFTTEIKEVENRLMLEIQKHGCPVEQSERRAIPDLYSMIREMGEGDSRKGITRIRRYFVFIESLYNKKAVVTGAVFSLTILSLIGWMVLWSCQGLLSGIKDILGIGR